MAKSEDDGVEWSEELVRRVGLAAKEVRGKRSAKWLSDRTAELGYRISPQVIAKLDNGSRGSHLQVAELLVLARALDTAPILLLFPGIPGEQVEVLPNLEVESARAASWFESGFPAIGYQVFYKKDEDPDVVQQIRAERNERVAAVRANTEPIRLSRQHDRLVEELGRYKKELESARQRWFKNPDNATAGALAAGLNSVAINTEDALRRLRTHMRTIGLVPPSLSHGYKYIDEESDDA